jgi:Tfp pilus assembly protein PilN
VKAVNLLPPDIRGAASAKAPGDLAAGPEVKGGGAGPFIVLGVLAACVAGTAAYVLTNNTIEQSKADLAQVTAQQQAIAAEAAKLQPYADFESMANSRVETVRDLAGRRFDWDQALRDLSRAIPADVSLASLNGDLGAGAGAGASPSGGSGLRAAIDAPAITMQGCTRDQRSVARLMARLRNVDGVTRVSLSKSVKADDKGGAAINESASGGTQGPACGSGAKPSFEVTMFFEDAASAVASQSAGATATPAPGATATPAAGATATPTPSATATPESGTTTTASTTSQGGATP